MVNLLIIGILLVILGTAILYIRKEKEKGTRCIGCPSAGCCRANCIKKKHNMRSNKKHNKAIETLWFSYYNNLRYEMKMIHHSVESFYVKEKFAGKMQNICDGKRETENGG